MPKKNKALSLFMFLAMLLSFVICLSFADLISGLIVKAKASETSSYIVSSGDYSIYALSAGSYLNKDLAEGQTDKIKQSGGAGYVWKIDKTYNILLSAYENESDAENVQSKLATSSIVTEIIKIDFQKIDITDDYSVNEKNILNNSITALKKFYRNLYDLTISLDTKIINDTQAKIKLAEYENEFKNIKASFDISFNSKINNDLLLIKIALNSFCETIQDTDSQNFSQSYTTSCQIKNYYFKALKLFHGLCKDFN